MESWYQKNYPIIGEYVGVDFISQKVTIAKEWSTKTHLILALRTYNKKISVTPIFLLSYCDKHDKMQLFTELKKSCGESPRPP